MPQINTREICLLASTAVTTTGTGPDINLIQAFQAAIVSVNVSAATGTSPTIDVYVQNKLGQAASTDLSGGFPTGAAIYDDILHFAQMTTTGTRVFRIATAGGNQETAQQLNALAAASAKTGPLGGMWRVSYVVGGTSPSVTFSVSCQCIPYAT